MDFEGRFRNSHEDNDLPPHCHLRHIGQRAGDLHPREEPSHPHPHQPTDRKHGPGRSTVALNRPLGGADVRLFPKLPTGTSGMPRRVGYGM